MRNLLILLLLLSSLVLADEITTDLEVGHQFSYKPSHKETTINRLYLIPKAEYSYSQYSFAAALRATAATPDKTEAELRELWGAISQDKFKLTVGFQEIGWGETFGFYPADLVNPRDFSDPLMTDLGWVRRPVFAINGQLFINHLTLQGVITPVPRAIKAQLSNAPNDAEFGGKAGFLFETGLDLGILYFNHWGREVTLSQPANRVHSFGATLSKGYDEWVLRADSIMNSSSSKSELQSILGADWNSNNSLTIGGQYHTQVSSKQNSLHWVSLRAHYKTSSDTFEPEIFAFRGLNNSDLWIQPKLTWNINGNFAISVRADLLWAAEDRVLSWLTYKL